MKLAILAKGETVSQFPGHDGYDEVWGLNQQAFDDLELDRLYVMDDLIYRLPHYDGWDLADCLKDYRGRIITSKAYDEWPTSEAYPIEKHCKYFGLPMGAAMYSTPDYMIAQAIMEGWKEIDLFGVDNLSPGLHEMRAATTFWIGVAMAEGIKVTTPPGSFYQFFTNVSVGMEYGLYGYHFRPRIENLVRR